MAKKQTTSSKKRSSKPKNSKKTKPDLKKINSNTSTSISQNADIYTNFANGISSLLEEARHLAARSVNAILTATYWEMGRRIVEIEQNGKIRAEYGTQLLLKLSQDLTGKFGRGFSVDSLERMRMFYNAYPQILDSMTENAETQPQVRLEQKSASVMRKSISEEIGEYLTTLAQGFPLSWTHYIRLMSVKTPEARRFYEAEAIRGGWSVRQLNRQVSTLFYERTALSKDRAAMLIKGSKPKPEDILTPEEEIKDPVMLEFLGLKDEYSESQLEEALIRHLETFLMELGNDFTFAGRQKRIRVGNTWYRMDLLFYHRRLRCLIIIDLKVGQFTHADAGQMNLYLNYALEHLTLPDENPPVGLILCSEHDKAAAHYAMGNMLNKVMATEYRLSLPDPKQLEDEIGKTRRLLQRMSKASAKAKENSENKKPKRKKAKT